MSYILKFETNINCNNCIRAVSPYLNNIDDVDSWKVDIDDPRKILSIEVENENGIESVIIEKVLDAGFTIKKLDN